VKRGVARGADWFGLVARKAGSYSVLSGVLPTWESAAAGARPAGDPTVGAIARPVPR
jgi:hypothetical protein